MFNTGNPWKDRLQASTAHFVLSLGVALLAAALVFGLWYPYPYREISGGRELFFIIVAVDVVMGPLLTFAVFNRKKPMKELQRDLAIIVLLQLAALGYGLWTVFISRPAHLVFEYDRFRVVHAIEVDDSLLDKALPTLRSLPVMGPTTLSLRAFKDGKEEGDFTMAALGGVQLSARPELWQDYGLASAAVLAAAKPVAQLKARFASRAAEIDAAVAHTGRAEAALKYLPLVGRKSFWTVLVDAQSAQPLAYLPMDSF
jgi:hypothetical protein